MTDNIASHTKQSPNKLTMDMHSVSHNVKFSYNDIEFAKYSVREQLIDIKWNVIEELQSQFKLSPFEAEQLWAHLEVEIP